MAFILLEVPDAAPFAGFLSTLGVPVLVTAESLEDMANYADDEYLRRALHKRPKPAVADLADGALIVDAKKH